MIWFNGNAKIQNSQKYEVSTRGHQRCLTVKNCHQMDQGQIMVQIQNYNNARCEDRLRIAHLRIGIASPAVR